MRQFLPARRLLRIPCCCALTTLVVGGGWLGVARAITVDFDYRFDQSGFFGTQAAPTPARAALEWAGRAFESFSDSLAAIQPNLQNTWTATFDDPTSGVSTTLPNLPVASNHLVVFVGAYDMTGAALGEAGPGSGIPNSGGSAAFVDAVMNRGEGDPRFDFAPWGGAIQFDTASPDGQPRQWHYDLASTPDGTDYDFYTVAVHELAHLFGFGTSTAFFQQITNGEFVGPEATALYGGPVPLVSLSHWANTVTSPPFEEPQPRPSLGPMLAPGVRRLLSPLDYAALSDIGWNVPGELLGLPGDVNGDGSVDGSDLLDWQQGLGGAGLVGDASGNGVVDALDRWLIDQHYGARAASAAVGTGRAIPEPGTIELVVSGLLIATAKVRKRRRCACDA